MLYVVLQEAWKREREGCRMCALRLGKMQATIGHLKARADIARQEGANGRGEGKGRAARKVRERIRV